MGASKKIKKILIDKDMTQLEFSQVLGRDYQQVKNALSRDSFTYRILDDWLDAIGCDIVFKDRKTGKLYE